MNLFFFAQSRRKTVSICKYPQFMKKPISSETGTLKPWAHGLIISTSKVHKGTVLSLQLDDTLAEIIGFF